MPVSEVDPDADPREGKLVVCPRNGLTSLSVADNTAKPADCRLPMGVAVLRARKLKCQIVLVTHH